MDTQNTPIHPRLWHKDFWLLSFANMLLTMSVYMLIPILPAWLFRVLHLSAWQVGLVMGAYGVGLFLLGPFCNYLVQRYRRNRVCIFAIVLMGLSVLGIGASVGKHVYWHVDAWYFVGLRLLLGAAFGLAQMVLSSTLVIDTCESFQRTEANHAAAWFGRFGISLGPLLAVLLCQSVVTEDLYIVIGVLLLIAIVLLNMVHFPFKAPDDAIPVVSCDRFFLPNGKWLFLNLAMMTCIVGMLMTLPLPAKFWAMLMVGFLLAILAEKFAFADADLKSEAITGLILLGAAELMMLRNGALPVVSYLAPACIGFGIGIIGSRFLLFFIKLSLHCQRGTSQSTFFLAWELGISIGLTAGFLLDDVLPAALGLTLASLLLYNYFTHPWYMKHKNR